jgi:hypothetical protein
MSVLCTNRTKLTILQSLQSVLVLMKAGMKTRRKRKTVATAYVTTLTATSARLQKKCIRHWRRRLRPSRTTSCRHQDLSVPYPLHMRCPPAYAAPSIPPPLQPSHPLTQRLCTSRGNALSNEKKVRQYPSTEAVERSVNMALRFEGERCT